MQPREVEAAVERALSRILPRLADEPLLWSVRTAQERTGLPRDRLLHAFHAGEVSGLWSGGVRGKGSILLKPESVRAWVDAQVTQQAYSAPRGRGKEMTP